jgi:hypothetical protein
MIQRSPLINKLSKLELMNITTETVTNFHSKFCILIDNLHYFYRNGRPIKKLRKKRATVNADIYLPSKKLKKDTNDSEAMKASWQLNHRNSLPANTNKSKTIPCKCLPTNSNKSPL